MGSYKVSKAKMNVMLIFLVLCIRFATNYFFKASNGIWWPVFVTVLHLTFNDCRNLSFSRVTCCFDWSSSHFDSWQFDSVFKTLCFCRKKNHGFPLYQYQLTGFWNKNCCQCDKRLWYRNVILTNKNVGLACFAICLIDAEVNSVLPSVKSTESSVQ